MTRKILVAMFVAVLGIAIGRGRELQYLRPGRPLLRRALLRQEVKATLSCPGGHSAPRFATLTLQRPIDAQGSHHCLGRPAA
jgi:hypothetical protein